MRAISPKLRQCARVRVRLCMHQRLIIILISRKAMVSRLVYLAGIAQRDKWYHVQQRACCAASARVPDISPFVEYVRRLEETQHKSSPREVVYYAVRETHYMAPPEYRDLSVCKLRVPTSKDTPGR